MSINWDDPSERSRLIERVGIEEYERQQREHFKRSTVATVNGRAIHVINSGRFGRIYMVEGLGKGHATLDGAKQIALEA